MQTKFNRYLPVREIAELMNRHPNTVRKYFDRADFAPYRRYKSEKQLLVYWCKETETMLRKLLSRAEKLSAVKKIYYKKQQLVK